MLGRKFAAFFFFPLKELHWVQAFWVSIDLTRVAGHWAILRHCSPWPVVPNKQDKAQDELWCCGCCIPTSARRSRSVTWAFLFNYSPSICGINALILAKPTDFSKAHQAIFNLQNWIQMKKQNTAEKIMAWWSLQGDEVFLHPDDSFKRARQAHGPHPVPV